MAPSKQVEFKAVTYERSTNMIKKRFTTIQASVNSIAEQEESVTLAQTKMLKLYLNEINKKLNEFESSFQRAIGTSGDELVSDDILTQDQDEINELYVCICSSIEALLPVDEPKSSESTVDHEAFQNRNPIRLPKLDLPKFTGDISTWTSFINLFDTTIHNNSSIENVLKFQYLLSVVSGEPFNLIKSLEITSANYNIAYGILRERYHNVRRLQSLHLNQLLDLPTITASNVKELRQFVSMFTEHSQALTALDCEVTGKNPLLATLLLRKMDSELRKKLEGFRSTDQSTVHTLPQVNDIIRFLNSECTQNEDASIHVSNRFHVPTSSQGRHKTPTSKKPFDAKRNVSMIATQTSPEQSLLFDQVQTQIQCFVCNESGHKVNSCKVFMNKTPHERYQLVKQAKHCVVCLNKHSFKQCKSNITCSKCDKRHHSLLHFSVSSPMEPDHNVIQSSSHIEKHSSQLKRNEGSGQTFNSDISVTSHTTSQDQYSLNTSRSTILLGTLLVKLTTSDGNTQVFRALLDSGSMCELISERAANMLKVPRYKSDIQLTGINQNITHNKGQSYLDIETLSGVRISSRHPMLILDTLTVDLPRVPLSPEVFQRTQRFLLADPTFHVPGRVDVVLGCSLFPRLFTHEVFSLGPEMPYVMGTHFGYVVMGTAPCISNLVEHEKSYTNVNICLHAVTNVDLHASLQRFWQQEEPPVYHHKTQEEKICDDHFIQTHSRDETGRYVVRLPLKDAQPVLGSSKSVAERRLFSMEHKFSKNPRFSQLYHKFIDEYVALGHMSECNDVDLSTPHFFLPHHGVLKESSSTTKLRTVFDASAKASNGVSLNDVLFTGPKLQTSICDVLMQFRRHNVVFCCDIRQMYRQIVVHPADRNFQLILWRDKPNQDVSIFQLNTVTYGMNCSPYLAIRTLHQLADDEGTNYPAAAQVLKTQTYVDDIITGADTEEEAITLQKQLVDLLNRGGFELRKWVSNSKRILQSLPEEYLETPVFLQETSLPQFTVLGLHWSPDSDVFSYNIKPLSNVHFTKRSVLSLIAKVYDPCGFLTPYIMLLKCFMQLIWAKGLSWDEQLPAEFADKWDIFVNDMRNLTKITVNRSFQFSSSCNIELHGFCDASESGYAAIVYFRCESFNHDVTVNPVIAKSRVAPLKRVTLPRLELCAAHLLALLVAHCLTIFHDKLMSNNIHLWCDSAVVLTWLRTPSYKLKTYVANRVAQTQELVPIEAWKHISSAHNPADCASRGILVSQLLDHPLWWHGPPWLQLPSNDWPTPKFTPITLDDTHEVKQVPLTVLVTNQCEEWSLLKKFSSWEKLQRVMAYVLRFINNCRTTDRRLGHITTNELHSSRVKIYQLVQQSSFNNEIELLKKQQDCTKRIQRLNPFIDSDGLLRVGGRLKFTSLSYDIRHPILLPKHHHVVDILIDYYHLVYLHAGPQLLQAMLTRRVWILSARSVIRSRIYKCLTCFKHRPKNTTPLMGDLPPSRVVPAKPFLSTGIDYCGPFTIKMLNMRFVKHIKVYLCIFICMVTKAVHIEVVTDMTTDAFIAALTRFISRRGICTDVYSDCGTTFVGAEAVIRRLVRPAIQETNAQERIQRFTSTQGIKFHFNPPASPHQGGLWESAVKSAKHHLRRVMGDTIFTLPEFMTLSTQVEAMLNSRPLTPLSNDPSDLTALTPGHFLCGSSLTAVPEFDCSNIPVNRLKHWQQVQHYHQLIWKRWTLEYLHTLQQRTKWTKHENNLQVGQLVLLHTPSSPREWPLGRIVEVHPGSDGIVRVVKIKTKSGIFTRPSVKVFPLPLD